MSLPTTSIATERREETGEQRTCSACGTKYFLPLDGDPTRRCPGCDLLVQVTEDADRVRAVLDFQRGQKAPAASPAQGDALDQLMAEVEESQEN